MREACRYRQKAARERRITRDCTGSVSLPIRGMEKRENRGRSEGEIVEEVDWRIRQNEKEESNHGK